MNKCCEPFNLAFTEGTDNEGYEALLSIVDTETATESERYLSKGWVDYSYKVGDTTVGCHGELPAIKWCPWCGVKI